MTCHFQMRTRYGRLLKKRKSGSGQATGLTEREQWILANLHWLVLRITPVVDQVVCFGLRPHAATNPGEDVSDVEADYDDDVAGPPAEDQERREQENDEQLEGGLTLSKHKSRTNAALRGIRGDLGLSLIHI